MGVRCESNPLLKTTRGLIVVIAFASHFWKGSEGNLDANQTLLAECICGKQPDDFVLTRKTARGFRNLEKTGILSVPFPVSEN
jgi:hypothetical protein